MRLTFDRGTLLIQAASDFPGPRSLPNPLGFPERALFPEGQWPELRWDSRVSAFRAQAHEYHRLKPKLLQAGIGIEDQVGAFGTASFGSRGSGIEAEDPALRPYQEAALSAWALAGRRGIVALPTGSGKTRIALAAMRSSGLSVLCLVPTRILLEQWVAMLRRHYGGPVGIHGDGSRSIEAVTVSTFESAYRHMSRLGNRFELLVVDEAHHFGAGVRDEALEMAIAPFRLGLTATPPKLPGPLAKLKALIGPVVYELSIGDLRGGFLSDFDLHAIPIVLSPAERLAYDADHETFRKFHAGFSRAHGHVQWKDFVRLSLRAPEGRQAIAAYRRAKSVLAFCSGKQRALDAILRRHAGRRTLIFTADAPTAYAVSRKFLVMPLTSEISRKERESALAAFREGSLRTLVSCRVLNEGMDVPDAEVAVIVGGSQGEREHVQRIGRLLRPGPGKRAAVYELVCRDSLEVGQSKRRRATLDS